MNIKTFESHSMGELENNIQLFLDDIYKKGSKETIFDKQWNTVVIDNKPYHYIIFYYG